MASTASPLSTVQAKVAIVVGCLSIAGFVGTVFNYFKTGELKDLEQDGRLGHAETDLGEVKQSMKELAVETKDLTKAVTRLTAVIENKGTTDRAWLDRRILIPFEHTSADTRTE